MTSVEDFEAGYHERVSRWITTRGPADAVLLGDDPGPESRLALAGWWNPDDAPGRLVLPNPWDERSGVAIMEQQCWIVTRSVIKRLTPVLDGLHGGGGERYWHLVLSPWLLILVSGVADRRLFLRAAAAAQPGILVVGGTVAEPPATMSESVQHLRSAAGNAALMTILAPRYGLTVDDVVPLDRSGPGPSGASLRREMAHRALREPRLAFALACDRGLARLSRVATGRDRGRRVAVVGLTGLRGVDELALARRVRGLRFPSGASRAGAPMSEAITGLRQHLPASTAATNDLEAAVLSILPAAMPRSLIEGFAQVQRASQRGYGSPAAVLVGNYSVDETQNEFIARCATAGAPVAFAQHGGFYGQAEVHAQERLEIGGESEFWSWGNRRETGTRTVASPLLARLRDTYRGGHDVVLVEGVHPPDRFVMRFASIPLANQAFGEADRLARLAQSAGVSRSRMVLKRYPTQPGAAARPQALAELPHNEPRGSHGAAGWMQRAAMVVVSYPDTPFIEALTIGAPTIGLWSSELYEWRGEMRAAVAALEDARVIFADPAAAAQHLDRVCGDPVSWWTSSDVVAATTAFLALLAPAGNWLADWSAGLAHLAAYTAERGTSNRRAR